VGREGGQDLEDLGEEEEERRQLEVAVGVENREKCVEIGYERLKRLCVAECCA